MPRSDEQYEQIRQEARSKILEASLTLFARKGFHGTSVSSIAEEAGISKGLLYNYFGNKEDVLQALIQDLFADGEEVITEVLRQDIPAWNKLEIVIRASFEMVRRQPDHWKLFFGLVAQQEIWDGIAFVLKQKVNEYILMLQPILDELGVKEIKKEVYFLISLLDGYSLQFITFGEELCPADQMISYILQQLKTKYGII